VTELPMLELGETRLRPWKVDDLPQLHALRNDVTLQGLLMSQPRPNSDARVLEWLARKTEAQDGIFFVIAGCADDKPHGYVQVVNIDAHHGTCELGICLDTASQGQGHGKSAMQALFNYLPSTFDLRKMTLEVLENNSGAIAFYHSLGFDRVGTRRAHFYHDGEHKNVVLMEIFFRS
jgi:RimJ/RimL family protein N-acetyltransferase